MVLTDLDLLIEHMANTIEHMVLFVHIVCDLANLLVNRGGAFISSTPKLELCILYATAGMPSESHGVYNIRRHPTCSFSNIDTS